MDQHSGAPLQPTASLDRYLCCALSLQLCYFLSPALASFIVGATSDRIKLGANIVIKINIAMKIFLGQQ